MERSTTPRHILLFLALLLCTTIVSAQLNTNFTSQAGCNGVVTFAAANQSYTSYLWSFGDNTTASGPTVTHNYSAQGTYQVALVIVNAPDSEVAYSTIYVGQFIQQQLTGPADVCAGTTAAYTLSNASANLQYNWLVSGASLLSGSQAASAQLQFSAPGAALASVIISNGAGCDSILKQNITVHMAPQLTLPGHSVDTQQINFGICQNTAVWYHVLSNTPGNITWSTPGGTTLSAQGVDSMLFNFPTAGVTTIQVVETTPWGCTDTVVATVTISANPSVTATATNACLGSASDFTATSNPPGSPLTYQWLFDDGSGAPGAGVAHTFTTTGQHTGQVIAVNSNGCVDTATTSTSVDLHAGPPVVCVGPVCAGAQEVYSTTPVGGVSYHWTITGGTITAGGTLNDNTVAVTWGNGAMGTVSLYLTGPGTYCQVATTRNVPLVGGALAIQGSATPCLYNTVTYSTDIIPGGVYTWSATTGSIISGQGTNQIQVQFYSSTAGTISVNINHQILSCSSNASLAVTPLNPFALYGPATACTGIPVNYSTNAGSFNWIVTGGTILSGNGTNNISVLWTAPGNYDVKATSAGGYCNTTADMSVSVIIRRQEVVQGSALTCAGSTETYAISPDQNAYKWKIISGAGTIVGSSTSSSVLVNWGAAGTDSLQVIYQNSNYCADTAYYQVVSAPPGVPAITGDSLVCFNTTVHYSFAPVPGVNYTWETTGGVITAGQGTANVSVLWIGNQAGILRLKNTACNSFKQLNIVIRPTPLVHILAQNLNCTGSSADLKVAEDYPGYSWSNSANTQSIHITTPAVYTVTVTDSKGCTATATENANPIPGNGFTYNNIVVSNPAPPVPYPYLLLFANASPTPTSYLWSTGNTEATQYAATTGTYTVTITNQYGCTATSSVAITATTGNINGGGGNYSNNTNLLPCPGISPVFTTNSPVCNPVQFTPGTTAAYYSWDFGDGVYSTLSNPTHRFSSAGTKTIILYYSNDGINWYQCSQSLTINSVMHINFTGTGTCNGLSTLTNLSTSAMPVSSVLWNFGDGTTSATTPVVNHTFPNTAAFFNVTLTLDDGVCTDNAQQLVSSNQLVANFTYADVCVNNPALFNDATLHSNIISSYNWSFGNGETEDYSIPVTYFPTTSNYNVSLTVTDDNGCSSVSTQSVPVNQFGTLGVTASGPLTFCQGSSVDLSLPSGYTLYWNTGDTGTTIHVTQAGTYFAFAQDRITGCSGFSDTITVIVNTPPAAFIGNPSGSNTFCQGGQFQLYAQPNSGVTYQWYANGAANSTGNALYFWYAQTNQTGSYQLVITDGNGCKDTSAATQININPLPAYPNVMQSPAGVICAGQPVTLSVAGTDLYQWSNGANGNSTTVYQSGNYQVVATNSFGCATNNVVYVNYAAAPDFTFFPTGCYQICQNSNITVTGPAGMQTYLWSNGASTQSITLSTSGSYTLSATATDGCTAQSGSFSVDVFGAANLNLGNDTTICAGQPLVLTAGVYPTITWQDASANPTYNVVDSGLYSVTVTTTQGCIFSDTIHVNIDTLKVNIGDDTTICTAVNLPLTALVNESYTGIVWRNGSTNPTCTVSQTGTYFANVTDVNGCKAGDTIVVNIVAQNIFLGNDTTICAGTTLPLHVTGTFTGITWQDGSTNQTYTVVDSGLYYVSVTTSQGCALSDTIHVNVDTLLVNIGNDTTVCSSINLPVTLTGNYTSITWQDGSTGSNYDITGAGLYKVTVTDAFGCRAADSLRVTSVAASINLGNDTTICNHDSVLLQVNGSFAGIIWQDGSTGTAYTVTQSGVYDVTVTTATGCTVTDNITVNVHIPLLTLNADTTLCIGQVLPVVATGNFVSLLWPNGSTGYNFIADTAGTYFVTATDSFGCKVNDSVTLAYFPPIRFNPCTQVKLCDSTATISAGQFNSYYWSTSATTESITVWQLGTYNVWVTDNNGCTAMDSISVSTCDTGSIEGAYFIPNAFTPNGDGRNDQFIVFRKPGTEPAQFFSISIFDRIGEKVFESDDETVGWDGRFKGKLEPSGVYVYVIKYVSISNHLTIKGAVTLLR